MSVFFDAMTRKKVKLSFILNDSARKATFKKRKKGLIKKVSELTTLCGIEACAVIYSPYESHPEVWPSVNGVQRVIARFRNMPEMEQSKKMMNQESFLRQRITKADEQLKKLLKENREKEITRVMFDCLTGRPLQGLTVVDLSDLGWVVDQHLNGIAKKDEYLNNPVAENENQTLAAPTMAGEEEIAYRNGEPSFQTMEPVQRPSHPWFIEMANSTRDHHHHHHNQMMGFGAEDMILPFGDRNHSSIWSTPFSP